MSIHATFWDDETFIYDPYPYEELRKGGHLFFCEALGSDYIRVSLDEGPWDDKSCGHARVDISLEQLRSMRDAISEVLKCHDEFLLE